MEIVTIIGGIVVVFVALAGAAAFFTSNLKQSTENIVRKQNGDLRDGIKDLTIRLEETEAREDDCKTRLTKLEIDHDVLLRTAAGEKAIEVLSLKLSEVEISIKNFIELKMR